MGQNEVYNVLKKNKHKWFSVTDMQKKVEGVRSSITTSFKKLRESGFVIWKEELINSKHVYLYKYKGNYK